MGKSSKAERVTKIKAVLDADQQVQLEGFADACAEDAVAAQQNISALFAADAAAQIAQANRPTASPAFESALTQVYSRKAKEVAQSLVVSGGLLGTDSTLVDRPTADDKPNSKTIRAAKPDPLDNGSGKARAVARKRAAIADAVEQFEAAGVGSDVNIVSAVGGSRARAPKTTNPDALGATPSFMRMDNE